MDISKRGLVLGAGALAGAGLGGRAAAAAKLLETRPMDLGPFYPVERPLEEDADLTRLAGHKDRAKGQIIELAGRVLRTSGEPVAGARVEIWQANAVGRYRHHGDDHANLPLDPGFQGDGVIRTDAQGWFRFLTVKPGAYPAGDFMRAPHIHFDVSGKWSRLISQMYFPGEKLLFQDKVLFHDLELKAPPKAFPPDIFGKLAAGASTLEKGAALCRFDIVLGDG